MASPNQSQIAEMYGGGFRYVPRKHSDEDLLIRVNEYTDLTDDGEVTWCWPPDIDTVI
ncbi:hypothetical protein C6A87_006330 [Mycobacterium sp. ITM-2016-00317]|uniref:hypothetical protein n=1 Tax=Mycobacterium sp. ITM-2016-00317 TaxID=2099694 RepID=UPI00287FC3C1|nr:hypothetical protein [Mycobacterium sp. ITM-2016-00317]WNG88835.1 hypothetical protein C6A87_006330 [Mycobacterium sp. ITM-2016-00317]